MNQEQGIERARARKEILRRRAQEGDFWAFCLFIDFDFFTARPILKRIADALQRVYHVYRNGLSIRVSCSLPPRAGKSYITSLFSAFMLGHFPKESVMRNTCSAKLYAKFSIDTRDIIRSPRYLAVFPDTTLHGSRQNIDGWSLSTAKQVSYFGGGVGGTIIGFGASMLSITDDLFKSFEDAASETINENTWSWKEGTHDSRTEGNCCQIDIGTRWSKNDVIGRLEERNKYDIIVRIPALIDGLSFCEDVHTTDYYLELQSEIDEYIWAAEYMQEPLEIKGLLFPLKELNQFTLAELEGKRPDSRVASCDVADQGNDYFSAPFTAVHGQRFFVTDVVFTQDPVEVTEGLLVSMILESECDGIRIESNAAGRIFSKNIQKLLKEEKSTCHVQPRFTTANKETKILLKSGFIKKYFWFRSDYERGSDYAKFMKQLCSYLRMATNQADDAPDSMVILAEYIEHLGILKGRKPGDRRGLTKAALGIA